MAIARGAGTEILRVWMGDDVDTTAQIMVKGVQHHIYTILSITAYAAAVQAAGNWIASFIYGFDAVGGTASQNIYVFKEDMSVEQTYVWNDKFSFNGFEPTDFAGPMDDATKQDAIADQGSSVATLLKIGAEHASDNIDVTCTYIDQNNA